MRSIVGFVAGLLLLGAAAVTTAQTAIQTGTVVRIDPQSSVVVLDDGRMYRVTPNTMLVVDDRPTTITALRPGHRVVIQSGEVVAIRDGRYVTVAPPPAVVTQAPPTVITQAPPAVVTQAPPPATAVPVGVRQSFHGTVESVDRDGEVKIKTERDSFEVKVGTEALRSIKKGDNVVIDLTITPPGAPSASPR
jgi:preprotein translocase subunit YajC